MHIGSWISLYWFWFRRNDNDDDDGGDNDAMTTTATMIMTMTTTKEDSSEKFDSREHVRKTAEQSIDRLSCTWFSAKHISPDRARVQGPLFDFEPRTWTKLKVRFQRGSKHTAFHTLSSSYLWSAFHPRCQTVETPQNCRTTSGN